MFLQNGGCGGGTGPGPAPGPGPSGGGGGGGGGHTGMIVGGAVVAMAVVGGLAFVMNKKKKGEDVESLEQKMLDEEEGDEEGP